MRSMFTPQTPIDGLGAVTEEAARRFQRAFDHPPGEEASDPLHRRIEDAPGAESPGRRFFLAASTKTQSLTERRHLVRRLHAASS